jgi:hypothetical protein
MTGEKQDVTGKEEDEHGRGCVSYPWSKVIDYGLCFFKLVRLIKAP